MVKIPMPSGIPRLLLFDIDGTLTKSSHYSINSILRSMSVSFGYEMTDRGLYYPGSTVPKLVTLILHAHGITASTCKDYEQKVKNTYQMLPEVMSHMIKTGEYQPEAIPYARELIYSLSRFPEVRVGLVTGNLQTTARIKLKEAGFDLSMFAENPEDGDKEGSRLLGAFGSDHGERNDLVKIALNNYSNLIKKPVKLEDVVVIGDTPRDIKCAHENGVSSFCVATGHYDVDDLKEADFVSENFENINRLKQAFIDPKYVY